MRIGIITYWDSDNNYGQLLQCYALQAYLRTQGYDAFLIRYKKKYYPRSLFQKIKYNFSWKGLRYRFSSQRKEDLAVMSEELRLSRINMHLNQQRKFEDFRKEYLRMTEEIYSSLQELQRNPPEADVYICGSDQIWNNSLEMKETSVWYLNFGDKNIKRISYAASIGRDLQKKEYRRFKKYLSHFDAISVREEGTKSLCEQLDVRNTQVTLDPTLLLPVNEYRILQKPPKDELNTPYLFMYILNVTTCEEIYWGMIDTFLRKSQLQLKVVCSSGYTQARELIEGYHNIQATLPEWLYYIDNSRFVITTSFHGIVFCIKMHKPFLVVLLENRYSKGNDRIVSLLKSIGLSDRILNIGLSVEKQMCREINWTAVEQRIKELQSSSYKFLKDNLV